MTYELHPAIETFSLLTVPSWGKEQKKEAIRALDDFGINGTAFYAANFPLLETYIASFARRKVTSEGCELIETMADELALSLIAILFLHPEWAGDFDSVTDEEAGAAVRTVLGDILQSDGDEIDAVHASGFSDKAKWQITALLQQPRQRLQPIMDAIRANLPAFDCARTEVEGELRPLLARLEEQVAANDLHDMVDRAVKMNPDARIVPSLASSLGLIVFEEFCVVGLLVSKVFSGQNEEYTKTEALLAAKALGDANRVEILKALKSEEMYNLEIARLLELTPATTSHHMNALLSAGFVEGSLRDGKAYYRLCPDGIERYRAWLKSSFVGTGAPTSSNVIR